MEAPGDSAGPSPASPQPRHRGLDPGSQAHATRASSPPRVLAVCTGNISRSPAVEYLLRSGFGDSAVVSSAGVGAVVGAPVDPPVAAHLEGMGIDVSAFAARQLSASMVAESDLVLALTRKHRARVLELVPSAVRRTYTLREFARILTSLDATGVGNTPGQRLASLLPRVAAGGASAPRRPAAEDDVVDPYGRSPEVYRQSLADMRAAVGTILARLTAPS